MPISLQYRAQANFAEYDWDEDKCDDNIKKHEIDFRRAKDILESPHAFGPSPRDGEKRYAAIGEIEGKIWTLIYTEREGSETCRVISFRRAREEEEASYRELYGGGDAPSAR